MLVWRGHGAKVDHRFKLIELILDGGDKEVRGGRPSTEKSDRVASDIK